MYILFWYFCLIALTSRSVSVQNINSVDVEIAAKLQKSRRYIEISSFKYNPVKQPFPIWAGNIFGENAVYMENFKDKISYSDRQNDPIFLSKAKARFRRLFPHYNISKPSCSYQMLGVEVNSGPSALAETARSYKIQIIQGTNFTRIIGNCSLTLEFPKQYTKDLHYIFPMNCFYRDAWRSTDQASVLFIYCPSYSERHCELVEEMITISSQKDESDLHVKGQVYMAALVPVPDNTNETWNIEFNGTIFTQLFVKIHSNTPRSAGPSIGVCAVKSYSTFYSHKKKVVLATMYDWMTHYLQLGFRVMIYDREGSYLHYKHFPSSKYRDILKNTLLGYYPYTVVSLLDPSSKGLTYDNSDAWNTSHDTIKKLLKYPVNSRDLSLRVALADADKSLTITHCRHELHAIWGIGQVLVVDLDEFLACPFVHVSSMASFVEAFLNTSRSRGMAAIELNQRMSPSINSSEPPDVCIRRVFDTGVGDVPSCYNLNLTIPKASRIKTFNADYAFPLSNYHHTCYNVNPFYGYDCAGYKASKIPGCWVQHFATKAAFYPVETRIPVNTTR